MTGRSSGTSRTFYVPSAVSSFFEICDRNTDGSKISELNKVGARGGGFVIERGSQTQATTDPSLKTDTIVINGKKVTKAITSLTVIGLMRKTYDFGPVLITHEIEPPIGFGFGTSGSGAIGAAFAIADLFDLKLTLMQASEYAHVSEVMSLTGLGTVISLASGSAAIGLVTEPGSFSVGRVDGLISKFTDYILVCACFGPIVKSSILLDEKKRQLVNENGRATLESILSDPTSEALLRYSRIFAEKTGLASKKLLKIADRATQIGALGATQNMIGNAVHCLVLKKDRKKFLRSFSKIVPPDSIFETPLIQSGPRIV